MKGKIIILAISTMLLSYQSIARPLSIGGGSAWPCKAHWGAPIKVNRTTWKEYYYSKTCKRTSKVRYLTVNGFR